MTPCDRCCAQVSLRVDLVCDRCCVQVSQSVDAAAKGAMLGVPTVRLDDGVHQFRYKYFI